MSNFAIQDYAENGHHTSQPHTETISNQEKDEEVASTTRTLSGLSLALMNDCQGDKVVHQQEAADKPARECNNIHRLSRMHSLDECSRWDDIKPLEKSRFGGRAVCE